jgi:uncharacterized protein
MRALALFFMFLVQGLASHVAHAQPVPLGNIIGGVLQAAAQENARKEWQALTPVERYCLNVGLQRSGNDINRLIQQGIAPSDPRLQNLQNTCMQITARDLNPDVECNVNAAGGSTYVSRCRQGFARLDPRGNFVEIDLETAITDTFAGRKPEIGLFQRPDAANRWREQQAAGGDKTRVVTPSFSCEKAKRPVELAICNSYDLSLYDREYADLWARAKPMDPKGDIAKQLATRNKARDACNANAACIRDNTEKSIEIVGTFLRSKGVNVTTLADNAAERRQKEAEEKSRAEEAARLKAEQMKAEAEAAREAAAKRAEEAKRREGDAADYAALKRETLAAYKAGRKPDDLAFLPPQKTDLDEDETKLADSACGSAIRTQDAQFAAFALLRQSKNDLVQRSCRVELGIFELSQNRRDDGLALIWSAVNNAPFASGRLVWGWTSLAGEWVKDNEVKKDKACAAIHAREAAFLSAPFRKRDGKMVAIVAAPFSAQAVLGCDQLMSIADLVDQQIKLCGVAAPEGTLDTFTEQTRSTCWIQAAGHNEFRSKLAARLEKETAENFEELRLQKVVSVSSTERRAFQDSYEACREEIRKYPNAKADEIGAAPAKINNVCRDFLKKQG